MSSTFGNKSVLPPINNPIFKLSDNKQHGGQNVSQVQQPVGETKPCDGLKKLTPLPPTKSNGPRSCFEEDDPITRLSTSPARICSRPRSRINRLKSNGSESKIEDATSLLTTLDAMSKLSELVTTARSSADYTDIEEYFSRTFASLKSISEAFKIANSDSIDYEYLGYAYESIGHLPPEIEKITLRAILNCFLNENASQPPSVCPFLVLLICPLFDKIETYVIFAHLIRHVANLHHPQQRQFITWMRSVPLPVFKRTLRNLFKFIATRLLKKDDENLPSLETSSFWIPSAVKVTSTLYAANSAQHPPLIPYTAFYCPFLDYIDIIKDYHSWQNKASRFLFCQYPFLLSVKTKRHIIQKDSELRMIAEARSSLVQQVQQKMKPRMGMLFLNLTVRRRNIVSDSLNEVALKKADLKKKLRVSFVGEPGLDMGGVSKEWFLILLRKVFREEYGMFTLNRQNRMWWFNPSSVGSEQEFNLVGVLMGLAVYNSMVLDVNFPLCCYKKILSPAVVPFQQPNATVGVAALDVNDLQTVNPELARGLRELLDYNGDVENDLCQTFQVSFTSFGEMSTVDLKANGSDIPVNKTNREEFVSLYVDYLLNRSIYSQFAAFYHGFHSVCASNALILLRPEEVEILVCGQPDLDISALQKVTTYQGYKKNDSVIRLFWDITINLPTSLKKKLLLFVTGSDRTPVGGMAEMEFRISKMAAKNSTEMLPTAHTCFNQLCLPPYRNKDDLKRKLTVAISNAEGFGME